MTCVSYSQKSHRSKGKLTIVPTPLGNLGDVTRRAHAELQACDVVCCEDTRVTGTLLSALGIEKRLERLDETTISTRASNIIERVLAGERIAYCSDAGMPGVSDPGQRLIACAYEMGAPIEVLPGGTAIATAYVASGFVAPCFYFGSFFPRKKSEQVRVLETLRSLEAVLIFYESPKRIVKALESVAEVFPARMVVVCRELTKLHEEIVRGRADEIHAYFAERTKTAPVKGEIVLVLDAPAEEEHQADRASAQEKAALFVEEQQINPTLSKKEMVAYLKSEFGLSRNDAYELVHHA